LSCVVLHEAKINERKTTGTKMTTARYRARNAVAQRHESKGKCQSYADLIRVQLVQERVDTLRSVLGVAMSTCELTGSKNKR
jgi:hypothetical protein